MFLTFLLHLHMHHPLLSPTLLKKSRSALLPACAALPLLALRWLQSCRLISSCVRSAQ
jgi:hypothetical protein